MKLNEYCDAINAEIAVRRYPNQNERWCAHFESCEISTCGMLICAHGNGNTPTDAINEYLKEIRGQHIVFNAMRKEYRREFDVPVSVEDMQP